MSHAYPALFLYGPADGKRLFVNGDSPYHQVHRQLPASFCRYDSPAMHAPFSESVTYVEVDRIEGTRIFAPVHARLCPGEARQRLLAGYQSEARH